MDIKILFANALLSDCLNWKKYTITEGIIKDIGVGGGDQFNMDLIIPDSSLQEEEI